MQKAALQARDARSLLGRIPAARVAELHPFLDAHGAAIDEGLALYFPAPHSVTGEDAPELQGQIGRIVEIARIADTTSGTPQETDRAGA